jgi:hypothetical protein
MVSSQRSWRSPNHDERTRGPLKKSYFIPSPEGASTSASSIIWMPFAM